ncbi:hypothetical protein QO002_002443 [Pararhizobium capsulatum DSM 1112]|uniref:BMC circularly permuted domain-containing protein n=1 Tax=Pararhizobium capsulatum DSM 1112 TaxID=1121113 RepID=A0ABU0BPZ1_9HYPH|nr:hypothetical protein [Pararhizobium capsulatum]MDQ0320305.1 hypothetical protein [Pararhizobium capsulatum DSM 1112]
MTELRVYLPIEDLQPQFAAYLSSPTRARGYPPFAGQNSLIIEVAPALAIHRITDLALKSAPSMEPGILYTERQFGLLELHSDRMEELVAAGEAILAGIGGRRNSSSRRSSITTSSRISPTSTRSSSTAPAMPRSWSRAWRC